MHKSYNPSTVHPPAASYSHALEVVPNARYLYLAGQGPQTPDGKTPDGIDAQADQVWRNIVNILTAGGMGVEDIVRVTTYVTSAAYRDATSKARAKIGQIKPASTFLVVAGLARPEMLIEIDVVAAKA